MVLLQAVVADPAGMGQKWLCWRGW